MLLQSSSGLRILRANIYYGEAGVISMKLEALSLSLSRSFLISVKSMALAARQFKF